MLIPTVNKTLKGGAHVISRKSSSSGRSRVGRIEGKGVLGVGGLLVHQKKNFSLFHPIFGVFGVPRRFQTVLHLEPQEVTPVPVTSWSPKGAYLSGVPDEIHPRRLASESNMKSGPQTSWRCRAGTNTSFQVMGGKK